MDIVNTGCARIHILKNYYTKKTNQEISARNKYFRKVQTFFSQIRLWQNEEKI